MCMWILLLSVYCEQLLELAEAKAEEATRRYA